MKVRDRQAHRSKETMQTSLRTGRYPKSDSFGEHRYTFTKVTILPLHYSVNVAKKKKLRNKTKKKRR